VGPNIFWTPHSRDKIAKHGVSEAEVEAVIWSRRRYVRGTGERTTLIGKSNDRFLFIVMERSRVTDGAFEVVYPRDATRAERVIFFKHRK
jgi:uncharacterized DUF497 family protein